MRVVLANLSETLRDACSTLRDGVVNGVSKLTEKPGSPRTLLKCLGRIDSAGTAGSGLDVRAELNRSVDLELFNCRVRIGRQPHGDEWQSVLVVEICGTIEGPEDGCEVDLEIQITDVTDNANQGMPVLNRPKQGPLQGSSHFIFRSDMGKLCHKKMVLDDWATVAQLSPEWFVLPRQGPRKLQHHVAIVSRQAGERLARTTYVANFENTELGYLDIEDHMQRAKTLAVALAFSVAVSDNNLLDEEVEIIEAWVRTHFGSTDASEGARLELERALRKTATFFRRGGRVDVEQLCREVVEIAPMIARLDILDLCLRVVAARGQVGSEELTLLKDLSDSFKVDRARLRAMVEKVLPVRMHETQDLEVILGVTEGMSKDQARHQLNREYAKWSSRVISSDPAIRSQADQMVQLIAEARTQFVGLHPDQDPE